MSHTLLSRTSSAFANASLASVQRSVTAAPPCSRAEGGTAANRSVTGSSATGKAEGEGVLERVTPRVVVLERERVDVEVAVAAALPVGEPLASACALGVALAVAALHTLGMAL